MVQLIHHERENEEKCLKMHFDSMGEVKWEYI